jgi:serine/threonine protein kinase
VGRTAGHFFYVMDPAEDVSGTAASADPGYRPATLERRLEAGPLPAEECFRLTRQLLAGLCVLHAAGVVHRDVKPANCLFVGGELKVADFGLLAEASPLVSRLGTRRYMPADGRMDARADVYAAGLVIYQMLTGQPVESFPSLGPRTPEIAGNPLLRKLNRLALRAAQPDPDQRFRDSGEMLARLEASDGGSSRPKRRLLLRSACLALAAVLVGAVVWRTFPRDRESSPEAASPPQVGVNFITEPYYNATIWLDGQPLLDAEQKPYVTPCTVPTVPSGEHHVVFRHAEHGELDARRIDFGRVREVEARWPAAPIRAGAGQAQPEPHFDRRP